MPIVNVNTPLQTVASPPSFIAELPAHPPSPPPATNRLPEATQKLSSANAQQSTKPAPQKFPVPGPHADAEAPRDVLRYCPEGDFTDFEGIWYTHLECLGFFVCSKCYNDYIYRSPYGNLFKGRTMASGTVTRCYFKTPRMLQLWSKTTESKSDTELKTFMESRPKIPECPKLVASERTWYTTTEGLDYRFTACQACYEDRIAPTNFKPYFKPGHPDPSKPTPLACEFGVKLVDRALKECAKQNSWPAFARSLNDRACLPKCTGSQHVDPNSRKWFGPVQHIDNIAICETCYSDNIIFTEFTSQFTQLRTDTLPQGTTWACVFWQPPICVAWSEVIEQKNFNIFLESARVLANSQCSHEATERDKWYTLAEGCENFDICLACYTGVIKPLGFAHFFKDVTYAPGSARMCDLNPKMQRFQLYMEKLQIAVTTNNFSPLSITLRKYANLPPCPRSEHVSGRAFYGDSKDYFTACLSCYEEVMTGTRFADKVQYKPSVDNGVCHMYGKLRAHWRTACANDDWDFFQAAVKHRTDIYLQVIPEMKQILAMGRIRMMTQMSMFSAGLMMQGGDAILSAAGGSGYDYGNSNVGYGFASSGGVQGAEMFNNAMNMRPHNAGDMMRAYQLEAMWKEVE
ncbi:hypothetical protein M501DRAFT_932336 [Patellaria atrata CBS 101060]|uniref:Integral membrane protein n=1 Tax=Patellaria atrata CBS 101060 TaxID=1346257 RepID=A0A9P4SC24_9PEZI|nr:hypothetical protein M501DRAFT_932336 [Patellaria atrata CBS 101060]